MPVPDDTAVKHATAMLLIMTMQDVNGDFSNVDYVKSTPVPTPATVPPDPSMLQDLLPQVNLEVYQAMNQMLNNNFANVPPVNEAAFQTTASSGNAILFRLSQLANLTLWGGPYPHPKGTIMRGVVSQLLA